MSKPKLFEFAVLHHPTDDEGKPNGKSVILVEPKRVLASTDQEAVIHASRDIPDAYLDKLEQVEIVIRPF